MTTELPHSNGIANSNVLIQRGQESALIQIRPANFYWVLISGQLIICLIWAYYIFNKTYIAPAKLQNISYVEYYEALVFIFLILSLLLPLSIKIFWCERIELSPIVLSVRKYFFFNYSANSYSINKINDLQIKLQRIFNTTSPITNKVTIYTISFKYRDDIVNIGHRLSLHDAKCIFDMIILQIKNNSTVKEISNSRGTND